MNDAETRMIMVEHRVKVLCRKQDMRLTAMLTILCLTLTVSLIGVTSALVAGGKGHIPGLYGSTMLLEDAGGYVLTGVLASARQW